MSPEVGKGVEALLEEWTRAFAAVTGSALVRCPACSQLIPERLLAAHAVLGDDDAHTVLLVMSS